MFITNNNTALIRQNEFRRPRGNVLCFTRTSQPLYAYSFVRLSQFNPDQTISDDVATLKKVIRSLKISTKQEHRFPKLDLNSVEIRFYTDVVYDTNTLLEYNCIKCIVFRCTPHNCPPHTKQLISVGTCGSKTAMKLECRLKCVLRKFCHSKVSLFCLPIASPWSEPSQSNAVRKNCNSCTKYQTSHVCVNHLRKRISPIRNKYNAADFFSWLTKNISCSNCSLLGIFNTQLKN